jgi:nucleoid-associated protein YgaU
VKTARRRIPALLAFAALLAAAGCGGESPVLPAETDESLYREGQQLEKQGRTQEALNAYLKVIAKRGEQAPESHLEVGLINLYHIKDPIAAIYHFTKYLELQPNSKQAVYVRGLIDSAKREFARSLPAQPLGSAIPPAELLDQVESLQRENQALKAEVATLRDRAAPYFPRADSNGGADAGAPAPYQTPLTVAPLATDNPPAASEGAPAGPASARAPSPAPAGRTHTVGKGDTLYSLAQRYYGSRSRWRDILNANREQLPNANALKIGMVLRIP